MLESLVAERYAKALLRACTAEGQLAELGEQAEALAAALQASPSARDFLADPVAEASAKLEALGSALPGGPQPVFKSFLEAVLELKRERHLPAILAEFARLREEAEGRVGGELGTARPLAPEDLRLMEQGLSRRLGRKVSLKPYTDRSLLGGAVLKLGDTLYDASLRQRLQALKRRLSEGPLPKGALTLAEPKAKPQAKSKTKPKAAAKAKPKAKPKAKLKAKPKPKKGRKP